MLLNGASFSTLLYPLVSALAGSCTVVTPAVSLSAVESQLARNRDSLLRRASSALIKSPVSTFQELIKSVGSSSSSIDPSNSSETVERCGTPIRNCSSSNGLIDFIQLDRVSTPARVTPPRVYPAGLVRRAAIHPTSIATQHISSLGPPILIKPATYVRILDLEPSSDNR